MPRCWRPQTKPHKFCPGCGHGLVLKALGEAIDELELQDRAIFGCDIGCSLLAWDFFNLDTVQTHHGRTIPVLVGMKHARPDLIVVAYMGDGGGYAIGAQHLVNAAARNEKISVIVANNTTYAMTGGQMAPTTLPDQKTETTPFGRDQEATGIPLDGPALVAGMAREGTYAARGTVANIQQLKRFIKRALENQIQGRGLAFVEALSACPTNWRTNARETWRFLEEDMRRFYRVGEYSGTRTHHQEPAGLPPKAAEAGEAAQARGEMAAAAAEEPVPCPGVPAHPVGAHPTKTHPTGAQPGGAHPARATPAGVDRSQAYRRPSRPPSSPVPVHGQVDQRESRDSDGFRLLKVAMAGEGGQGVQAAAEILAEAAFLDGREALYIPNFGVEQRGGVSVAFVQIAPSGHPIPAPKFRTGDVVVALSDRAIRRAADYVGSETTFVYDSSIQGAEDDLPGQAARTIGIPALRTAAQSLHPRVFNILILGAILGLTRALDLEAVKAALENRLGYKFAKEPSLRDLNYRALETGLKMVH